MTYQEVFEVCNIESYSSESTLTPGSHLSQDRARQSPGFFWRRVAFRSALLDFANSRRRRRPLIPQSITAPPASRSAW